MTPCWPSSAPISPPCPSPAKAIARSTHEAISSPATWSTATASYASCASTACFPRTALRLRPGQGPRRHPRRRPARRPRPRSAPRPRLPISHRLLPSQRPLTRLCPQLRPARRARDPRRRRTLPPPPQGANHPRPLLPKPRRTPRRRRRRHPHLQPPLTPRKTPLPITQRSTPCFPNHPALRCPMTPVRWPINRVRYTLAPRYFLGPVITTRPGMVGRPDGLAGEHRAVGWVRWPASART